MRQSSLQSVKGTLFAHGGGNTPPASTQEFIKRAGGPDAPLVVLPQSSIEAEAKGKRSADWLKENGAKNVYASVLTNPNAPEMPQLLKALETARGVWMPGGDQSRLMGVFGKTPVPELLRQIVARGGAVGGTSAGASLLGEWMPTGNGDKAKMIRASVETIEGLKVWPGCLVDTHFLARERWQRLVNMVLSRPLTLGLGIDEGAWVVFDGPRQTLQAGGGQVVLMRTVGSVREGKEGQIGITDLRTRVLLPGETVSLAEVLR